MQEKLNWLIQKNFNHANCQCIARVNVETGNYRIKVLTKKSLSLKYIIEFLKYLKSFHEESKTLGEGNLLLGLLAKTN